jgi:very-short-patch-repair endonuclease
MGLRIVRFGNDEVMKNLSAVAGKINKFIGSRVITNKE